MTKIVIDIELCLDCPLSRTDEDNSSVLICNFMGRRFDNKYEQKVPEDCKRRLDVIIRTTEKLVANNKEESIKGKCTHPPYAIAKEYLSQPYGTCVICNQTVFGL